MIERKTFPAAGSCQIAVTTEQMADGTWAVVASVKHLSDRSEKITDLPVPRQRFASQTEAEAHGVKLGEAWIEKNAPHAA
ncbi:MAG: hypothetical protein ACREM3_01975 [Candidatus Rokuibacteriota bacterium]